MDIRKISATPANQALVEVWVVLVSLLMSLSAFTFDTLLNRDGMHYLNGAKLFKEFGLEAAIADVSWPYMSIAIGFTSLILSIDVYIVGVSLMIFFGVSSAVLIYKILLHYDSRHTFIAAFVAVSVPFLLNYRPSIIRDPGAWFFLLGAFYSLLLWISHKNIKYLFLFFISVVLAVIFRREYIVLIAALPMLWLVEMPIRRAILFSLLIFSLTLIAFFMGGKQLFMELFYYRYFEGMQSELFELRDQVAASTNNFIEDDFIFVLLSGFFVLIVLRAFALYHLLLIPLVAGFKDYRRILEVDKGLHLFLALFFLAVLFVFSASMLFVVDRYIVPMSLCLLPIVYRGFILLNQKVTSVRIKQIFLTLVMLLSIREVIYFDSGKSFYKDAGYWIQENYPDINPEDINATDERIIFYALGVYRIDVVGNPVFNADARLHAMVKSRKGITDQQLSQMEESSEYKELVRFDGKKNREIVIFEKQ